MIGKILVSAVLVEVVTAFMAEVVGGAAERIEEWPKLSRNAKRVCGVCILAIPLTLLLFGLNLIWQ